jgi:predicted TIM-barrel fold metal-dependent hydrolase
MAIEGLGATLTRSGFSYDIKSLGGPSVTYEDIDITDLSTTGFKEYMQTILADIGEITVTIFHTGVQPSNYAAATTRITDRNAKYVEGSFYIKNFEIGDRTPGEAVEATITMKCTGGASALTWG